jgi:hypothetical protein
MEIRELFVEKNHQLLHRRYKGEHVFEISRVGMAWRKLLKASLSVA